MADDSLNLEVVLSARTDNVSQSESALRSLQDAVDSLTRSGALSEKQQTALSRTLERVGSSASSSVGGVKKAASEFDKMSAEVKALNRELQDSARLLVEQGNLSPRSTLASEMPESVARQSEAILEAEKLTVEGVLAERRKGEREKERIVQREADIYNDYLEHQYKGEQKAAANSEKVRSEQSRIYNDYLEGQYKADQKTRAQQSKIYDDYMQHQVKADQDYRKQMDAGASRLEKIQRDRLQSETKEYNRQMEARVKTQQDSTKGLNYDAHVQEYDKVRKAQSQASQQTALYNQYLFDQEKALKKQAEQAKKSEESIISLRYANYDLATTLLGTAAAITAVGAAAVISFASQESAFTEVERIAGGSREEIGELRDELQKMSTEIPVAFNDLSNIASLGAALDIPAEALDEFTNSVAKFSATTGVTVEAAATGFGKLAAYLEIPEEQFDALGSAILRAGNISVATEEQVLKFAQALALPGARIGFTTDQVVALGATLASFGNINVEGAGSALSRVAKNIERDLSESGEGLERWAATAGMSVESFRVAWGSDSSGTFNRIIQGLSQDVEGLTGNLDALGLRNIRDQRIIEALALNYGKYNQILGETTNAWRQGTYMNEAYGLVLDDLNSKWQIFVNAVTNAAAAVGSEIAPAFGTLLDVSTKLLVAFADFAESDLGGRLIALAAGAATLAAVWLSVRGAIALATGSALAMQFILRSLSGIGIINGLRGLAGAILGTGNAAKASAGAVAALRTSLVRLMKAVPGLAVFYAASSWIFDTGNAAQETGNLLIWLSEVTSKVMFSIADSLSKVAPALASVFALIGASSANPLNDFLRGAGEGLRDWGKGLSDAQEGIGDFSGAVGDLGYGLDDLDESLGNTSGGMGDLGDSAQEAAKEVRTLVDYANDLRTVWDRAFEIRFSGSQTADAITSTFLSLRDAADAAAKKIRDLKNDIRGLSSDIDIQEYFLSIAIEYGDTKRAEAIEADLLKKRAELADKTAELQKEQDAASKSLVGNTSGAIANRKSIQDLVQQYQAHIGALAASGMSQADLARATERLRQDFISQATQLGYNRRELEVYARSFDDVAVAISKVPRNITVKADTDPAIQAFNEFKAAADKANSSLNGLRNNAGKAISMPAITNPTNGKEVRRAALEAQINALNLMARAMQVSGNYAGALTQSAAAVALASRLRYGDYYTGGFTGKGGMYEPAGTVHRGEYVIPKRDVNQSTGMPYADALGRLMNGIPGSSSAARGGSAASAGVSTVSLSAGSIQAIAQAVQPYLIVDGQQIGEVTSRAYSHSNNVGAN